VVDSRPGDDGSIAAVPWASVFDPDNNARAIGAIQERGFRAAREVVDRLLNTGNRAAGPGSPGDLGEAATADPAADREGGDASGRVQAPDVDRVLTTWQKMMGQLADSLRSTIAPPAAAAIDLGNQQAGGHVQAEPVAPGAVGTAEVWLHNRGGTELGRVRLRCSDLLAHDGALLPASAVSFEPESLLLEQRSSRGVVVRIEVPADAAPGAYRGTLLADGHADVWLPVTVVVESAS
jgi:hypothetical protein